MAKQVVKKGDTSRIEYVFIQDSSSTTGAGLTGLAFNSAGLTAYYVRTGGTATAITLATQTAGGAYSSGGFVAVDGTNMPGVYRIDPPDAVFATGVDKGVVMLKGATNMAQVVLEYQLVDYDPENATTLGLTNLDAAISTRASQTSVDTVDNFIDTEIADIQARLPAALVGGRIDASVGAIAANAITAASIAADAVTEIQTGLSTLDAAGVRAAVGLAAANLDTQLTTIDDLIDTEVAAIFSRIGAPAGASIAADVAAIKAETASIQTDTNDLQTQVGVAGAGLTAIVLTATERNAIADAFLDRNMATGTDSGSPTVRTPRQSLRFMRNKWSIAAGTLTVCKEDDITASWTAATATTAGDPISSVDPA